MKYTNLKSQTTVHNRFKNLGIDNSHQLFLTARKGVKPKVFYEFAQTIKMPEKWLAGIINLSARTLSNYNEQQKALEPVFSEHLLKLIALYEKGEKLFGNIDEFNYWLKKPFWNSKEVPMNWLITHSDFKKIKIAAITELIPITTPSPLPKPGH